MDYKRTCGNFGGVPMLIISCWQFTVYVKMYQIVPLIMRTLLYVNYTSIRLFSNKTYHRKALLLSCAS